MKNQTCLPLNFVVKTLFFFLLLMQSGFVKAQSFFFDNYSVKEGLGQSTVYDIVQDSKGYLWIGTNVGVSYFDGIRFRNYTYENGLANDAVQRIVEDKWGNIWFGHKGGAISRLKDDTIQFFRPDTIAADITSLICDKDGNVWAGTFGAGAFKIKNHNHPNLHEINFIQYKGEKDKLDNIVISILQTSDANLLFIVPNGLRFFEPKENIFRKFNKSKLPEFYQFTCLFEDHAGNFWFGTDIGGLFRISKDGTLTSFSKKDGLAGNFISCINQDSEKNIWIGTWGNGISTIKGEQIFSFNDVNGLPDLKIRSIKPDLEGNILIGTNESGLSIFKSNRFINYSLKDGINGKQVNALLQDSKGRFWFGTENGISILERDGISFKNPLYLNHENGKLPENRIKFIREDRFGNVWIATEHSVLSWADKAGQVDYNFLINGYINQNSMVTAMEIDLLDNLWIGTLHGLIVYEINDDRVSFLSTNAGIAGNDISSLFADSKGRIWIGSNQKGLTIYNDKDTSFTILKAGLGYTPTCMTESADKEIWVGTQAHGLLVFKDLDLLRQYRMTDGLSSDYIASLTAGINGDIFIGTSRGLNIFKKDENQFRRYSEKAGFTGIEVKRNASVTDADGNVWFGTVNGATRVDISSEKEKPSVPPIRINNLKVNMIDRKITEKLVFSYDENSIVIEYVGICLTDPQSVIYRIMLEGSDTDWQPETNQNFASFSNLSPGKYAFKVIAKNNSGIWNTEPAILKFTIKPPFYNSISFYLIIIVSTIVLFIVFIKYRERALIIEKRVLAEKVAERTVEISIKNRELELKNKNITDSIKYAKRIQDAMLPDSEYLRGIFASYFIYFKPRDIISGDFYWATRKDEKIIFAVVDCTGHGVPGAFMSMLGITLFDEIVNKKNILDAGQILDNLREDVIKSLKQKGVRGETQDGMDVSLCVINTQTWEMQFAGAYNPMYLIRENEVIRLKGDRMPIGIYYKKTEKFQKQCLQLKDNDMLYLFTDGYADQFSEERGEKFMNKNLRNLLLEIYQKPLDKQKKILDENLKNWQGKLDQVDDILIFGTRIYTTMKTH